MTLYLVRHAIAEPRGDEWPDDSLRPLTDRGRKRMRQIAQHLSARGVEVERVLTSPLVRARQTADLLAPVWARAATPRGVDALAPGVAPARVAGALRAHAGAGPLCVVGHEPGLGELAAWLLGSAKPLPFRKGGAACLEAPVSLTRGSATLVWLATPRLLLDP